MSDKVGGDGIVITKTFICLTYAISVFRLNIPIGLVIGRYWIVDTIVPSCKSFTRHF